MRIRYDELKVGDIVIFHGAKERIVNVIEKPAPANEWYPNEKTIGFEVEPFDEEAEKMLGKFYSRGTYGGVGCLTIELFSR
jgi:hypothetical protein